MTWLIKIERQQAVAPTKPTSLLRINQEEAMQDDTQTFEFADVTITSREWQARNTHGDVVNPSSDNGRSAWAGDTEE